MHSQTVDYHLVFGTTKGSIHTTTTMPISLPPDVASELADFIQGIADRAPAVQFRISRIPGNEE